MSKVVKIESSKAWKARRQREKEARRKQQRHVDDMIAWARAFRAKARDVQAEARAV